jgi:Flp pilus assembly pilin Flp
MAVYFGITIIEYLVLAGLVAAALNTGYRRFLGWWLWNDEALKYAGVSLE